MPTVWRDLRIGRVLSLVRITSDTTKKQNFASPGGAIVDRPRVYSAPSRLALNEWAPIGRVDDGPASSGSQRSYRPNRIIDADRRRFLGAAMALGLSELRVNGHFSSYTRGRSPASSTNRRTTSEREFAAAASVQTVSWRQRGRAAATSSAAARRNRRK